MSHPVIHFELGGPDGPALNDFYHRMFDWGVQESGPDYWLLDPGQEGIAGGVLQTREDMPPYVTVYVAVDDLDAAMDRAEALGGGRVVPPTEIAGVGSFAMFSDPAGNVVGLMHEQAGPPD
jgi:uncharacterized protein